MTATTAATREQAPREAVQSGAAVTRGHLRSSVLMMAGRFLAMAATFTGQVIVVRYLTVADYGALAWAMGVVGILQALLPLGLDRVDTKYLVLFDERGNRPGVLGVLLLPATTVLALGIAIVTATLIAGDSLLARVVTDPATGTVVLIVLALGPAQALDTLLCNAFAVLSGPRAVFLRQFVIQPGLRLGAVLLTVGTGQGVTFLAGAYLVSGLGATAVFALALTVTVRRSGAVRGVRLRDVPRPPTGLVTLAAASLLSQLVALCSTELAGVLLGWFGSADDVAVFRAMAPLAMLNFVVMFSFATFFVPAAGRLSGRGDLTGLRTLHWRTAGWVAVLSAPALWLTVPFAGEVTRTVLGQEYAASATLLSLVSVGFYLSAASGFTGQVAMMLGRRRWLLWSNVAMLTTAICLQLVLISRLGPLGAALAVFLTSALQALLNYLGAGWRSPVGLTDATMTRTVGTIAAITALLWAVGALVDLPLAGVLLLVAMAGITLLGLNRRRIGLTEAFPELARVPLLGRLIRP